MLDTELGRKLDRIEKVFAFEAKSVHTREAGFFYFVFLRVSHTNTLFISRST